MKMSKLNYLASAALILSATQGAVHTARAADSDSLSLEEIVVTAQRKAESAQKAAIALDVVSTDELANAGITNVLGLNAAAPSLNAAQGGGGNTSYFVRGVGNFTNNAYTDTAVAFNYDGIYIGRPTGQGGAFFDLERIEVLKGPQGTLYGRNATGGAINVLPAKPQIGVNTAAGSITLGNYALKDVEAMGNVAVGDNAAFRLAGRVVRRDGYYDDGSENDRSESARLQFLTSLTDDITLRLSVDHTHRGGSGTGSSYLGAYNLAVGTGASATAPANYTFTPSNVGTRSGLRSAEGYGFFSKLLIATMFDRPLPLDQQTTDDKITGYSGELIATTPLGDLTVISAYRDLKLNDVFNGPSFKAALIDETDRQFSNEVRLNGTRVGPLDWILGLYYFDETDKGLNAYNQQFTVSYQDYKVNTNSKAAFARFTYNASDTLRFVAAARYTADKKSFNGNAITLLNVCTTFPPTPCIGGPDILVTQTMPQLAAALPASLLPAGFPTTAGVPRPFGTIGNVLLFNTTPVFGQVARTNRITYRVAAEFDVAEQSLLYASYETGYRSGGFSLTKGFETFKPEYLTASTIGSKNRFFNDRLQINGELFYWRYSDQQISHFGNDSAGNPSFLTDNAGKSTIKGVDVDVKFRATSTTTLEGSVQYLKNKLDEFAFNQPRLNGTTPLPTPASGCVVTPTTNNSVLVYRIDCAGKTGINSPTWAFNAGVEQLVPVGGLDLTFRLDGRYRGNRTLGYEYLPQQESGSDVILDANIKLANQKDTWSVKIWGRNITDEEVLNVVQYNSSAGNALMGNYAPPATYGVTAAYKFK